MISDLEKYKNELQLVTKVLRGYDEEITSPAEAISKLLA